MSYRINTPRVAGEIVEGEAIIIDLHTGAYFSTEGVGAEIWGMIDENFAIDDMVHVLSRKYSAPPDRLKSMVFDFLNELETANLITPKSASAPPDLAESLLPPSLAQKLEFVPPTLQAFTDMQDLMLLDPIHEVDEKGWPFAGDRKG